MIKRTVITFIIFFFFLFFPEIVNTYASNEGLSRRPYNCLDYVKSFLPLRDQSEVIFSRLRKSLKVPSEELCEDGFFTVNRGVLRPVGNYDFLYPGALRMQYLGEGVYGRVYRVFGLDEETVFIAKYFKEQIVGSSVENLQQELQAMKFLSEKLKKVPYKFPKVERGILEHVLQLENVYGKDLLKLVQDDSVPLSVRNYVLANYFNALSKLDEEVREKFIVLKFSKFSEPYYIDDRLITDRIYVYYYTLKDPLTGIQFEITTKPNNIVVTPKTLEMWLVDPA